jgi:hypothetical protein
VPVLLVGTVVCHAEEVGLEQVFKMYEAGEYEEAFRVLLPMAEAGDVQAQVRLGHAYYSGLGVPRDLKKACYWFRQGAAQGYGEGEGDDYWKADGARVYAVSYARKMIEKTCSEFPESNTGQEHLVRPQPVDRQFVEKYEGLLGEDDAEVRFQKAEHLLRSANSYERFVLLGVAAEAAFETKRKERAKRYARELLQLAEDYRADWNYGNAIHEAHTILGRLSLLEDRLEDAKAHLLMSAKVVGSPQLRAFGPSFELASDLLRVGERLVVMEYLERCKEFWQAGAEDLGEWGRAIERGEIPDFSRI